ncbi:MAG: hypothetical protein QMD80_01785 [archaeon]|nr:hypothetical protein [archaeon]
MNKVTKNKMIEMEIKPQKYRLAVVFRTVFFPFTYPELIDSVKKRGYGVPPSPRPIPSGPRIYAGGHIATKEGCTVEVKDERQLIASEGTQVEDVIKSFNDVMDISREDFHVDLERDVHYFELTSELIVKSDESPIENIERFMGDRYKVFDEIMGNESSAYTIRIVPKGLIPSHKIWFDITIEPRVTMAEREYYVNIVYRDEKIDNVLTFARDVNSKILSLISKIGEA